MAALSVPLRAAAAGSRAAVDPIKVYSPEACTLSLSLSLSLSLQRAMGFR